MVPEKQLQIALWTLGTQESFREVADRFDVSRPTTLSRSTEACRAALALDLAPKIICWPFGEIQEAVEEGFRAKSRGLYGIVGAVDGCHIPIKAPLEHPVSYVNRKSFHSVLLQGMSLIDQTACATASTTSGGEDGRQKFMQHELTPLLNINQRRCVS